MTTTKTEVFMVGELDAITGVTTVRELTADEITQRKVDQVEAKAREAEATAKTDARTSALAKLADLGLTQAEIEAL
jgi:hypothetical protein